MITSMRTADVQFGFEVGTSRLRCKEHGVLYSVNVTRLHGSSCGQRADQIKWNHVPEASLSMLLPFTPVPKLTSK
jgi:hypothetical protein